MSDLTDGVWVFNGANSRLPAAVFTSKKLAETYIAKYSLTGILTLYPLNEGVYDWAIRLNMFCPKKESEMAPEFIQKFTSASQTHFHYENGNIE